MAIIKEKEAVKIHDRLRSEETFIKKIGTYIQKQIRKKKMKKIHPLQLH